MDRAELLFRLRGLESRLRSHGVASLYLYGSFARDEARPDSDIDVLADFAKDVDLDLARFMAAKLALAEAFPENEIGLSTRGSLVPLFRPHIEGTTLRVF